MLTMIAMEIKSVSWGLAFATFLENPNLRTLIQGNVVSHEGAQCGSIGLRAQAGKSSSANTQVVRNSESPFQARRNLGKSFDKAATDKSLLSNVGVKKKLSSPTLASRKS